jgi:hypothetical protein
MGHALFHSLSLTLFFGAAYFGEAFLVAQTSITGQLKNGLRKGNLGRLEVRCAAVPPNHEKKVAVIGSGAVGLYYGSRLAEAGHHVSFLCRQVLFVGCIPRSD